MSNQCRNYLLKIYRKFNIQGNEFGVLAALTLGYTEDLQPDLRKSYSASGATHILSVSGLHVGTVYAVLFFIFGFLNHNQRQKISKIIIITLCMWGYAFITGLSPSVVRATLMFTFVALANCLERKSQIYNTIFMSAFFMLLVNPNFLFDIGFQLSYSAVLSIIFFQPPLTKLLPTNHRFLKWGRDLLLVSVAAQIGTAPFTLYYFQQFPNYFLLTNLLVIPLSTLVIYLAMGLLAVSFIPYLSTAVAFLLKISVGLLNFCIVQIEHLPYSLSYISLDIKQTILIFMVIFSLSAYYYNKKFVPLALGLISLLLVCVVDLQIKYNTLRNQKIIVFAGQKSTHVNFIDHGKNYVFTTDSVELERISSSYWRKHKLGKPTYINNSNRFEDGFASFYGIKILILTDEQLKRKVTNNPLNVNLLIIGNHLKPRMEQILSCVHPQKIIVDKSISNWYTNDIRQQCEKHGIEFYSVADQGAYILDIPNKKSL
jgi:competence protein ComEC